MAVSRLFALFKHFFGNEYRVQYFGKDQIRHAVDEGFDDFVAGKARCWVRR